jgi:hypothetical protein
MLRSEHTPIVTTEQANYSRLIGKRQKENKTRMMMMMMLHKW